ncbi:TIGR02302 family protein [Amaricoccus solimangrovi]|uniref:TIGR02302 family protein n=1 Tax=Amaricoccus solimangrovi TaxID=2589815 RepID=A0A501WUR9_9RHOB|nr:TIGR02302 family protein [Amaricoccus solimangrovi]TPE52482.1 TIGR02302 family protein [Amaricoccus solimangrovi]
MRQSPEDEIPRDDRLAGTIRRTRAGMIVERLLRAFWPLGSLTAAFWSVLAFGLPELLTRGQMIAVLVATGLAALWLGWRGVGAFRWPSPREARDRVDSTLPGAPLAALEDAQALGTGDPGSRAVWAAHLARMRRAATAARPVAPDLRLASRDPFALRLAALVLLGAALVFAGGEGLRGVGAAIRPAGPSRVATGPSFEGWAEPPDYTGRPTLYLPDIHSATPVSVPAGTRITIRVYGGEGADFALDESVSEGTPAALAESAPGIASAEFEVRRDGAVSLTRGGGALGNWSFAVEPDLPPTIALAEPVTMVEEGKTRIAYLAKDDHGIAKARAEIALDPSRADRRYGLAVEPVARPPLVIDLPMPMTGAGAEVNEALVDDFSKSPFAGLPVLLTLSAEDAIGQRGDSGPIATLLPARPFYDPLAAALVEQRRDLLWSPENATRVTRVLRAVTVQPDEVFDSPRAYLITRAAIRELAGANARGKAADVVDDVAEALWRAALLIEDGGLTGAKARLDRARERLSEALRNDASDEEIARLMDELRQATQDYMQQMAREAIERGEQQKADNAPQGQTMTQDQIQELMRRIQELSEQGRKAEAEQLLGMLQQLLDSMRMQVTQGGEGQGGQGQRTMQGLADALREQQGLADDSFQELQRKFRENRDQAESGQGENGSPQPGAEGDQRGPSASDLARRQEALRQLMEGMQGDLPGEAGEAAREAMRQAERSMGDARDRLNQGDAAGALDRQAEAIDRLREGMREMSKDMRQDGQQVGEGEQDSQSRAQNGRDPLGRPLGSRGGIGGSENMLPNADAIARGRALLDEIRRRAGEQFRPQLELDYLRRLLDQF